jgi:hypothetical protein
MLNKYGTRGTLRKPAESYKCDPLEQMDRELETIGKLMAFAICLFILLGAFAFGLLA